MHAPSDPATLWDDYRPTSLLEVPDLARQTRVARVFVKLENERPLGNFKALGGMVASLRALANAAHDPQSFANAAADQRAFTNAARDPQAHASAVADPLSSANVARDPHAQAPAVGHPRAHFPGQPSLPRLLCASDGNHGLSVAAAAARVGTHATVYLPVSANPIRADRIQAIGGKVLWINGTYDDAVNAAAAAAARGEGLLIPDTSPDPHDPVVKDVMAGYALLTRELRDQLPVRPTHVFVQAGVGGLAAAVAEGLRDFMSAPGQVVVVEPELAACVSQALSAGHPVRIPGALETSAEMLSCGLASASAIEILKRHNVHSILLDEQQLQSAPAVLRNAGGPQTTPSGAAGLAGLLHVAASPRLRAEHHIGPHSTVLFLVTERSVPSRQG